MQPNIDQREPQYFNLQAQLSSDPFFKGIKSLCVKTIDEIVYPQIPTLLPKDSTNITLYNIPSKNNHLCTALSSLAFQDELIYVILGCDSLPEDGEFQLALTHMGERKTWTITDSFICREEKDLFVPLFANSPATDVWALLLEKAYAYNFGLYSSILNGKPYEVIYAFVDGEYKTHSLRKEKMLNIWKTIKSNLTKHEENEDEDGEIKEYMNIDKTEKKKIIIVSTQALEDNSSSYKCYYIEEAKELRTETPNESTRYLKLRFLEPDKFVSSFAKENWDNQKENQIALHQMSSYSCWVSLDKISANFKQISINTFRYLNCHTDFAKNILKMSLEGEHSCVLVTFDVLNENERVVIGVHQKNRNAVINAFPDYRYSNLRMILLRLDSATNPNLDFISEKNRGLFKENIPFVAKFDCCIDQSGNSLADIFLKSKLQKGKYMLALETFWESTKYTNINISFYTDNNSYIPFTLISSGTNFDIVFYKAFLTYYLKKLKIENDSQQERGFSGKKIDITEKLNQELRSKNLQSEVTLEHIEFTTGFYMIIGKIEAEIEPPEITLEINTIFHSDKYVISSELINLLEGVVTGNKRIRLSSKLPLFFLLLRTNIHSKHASTEITSISKIFSKFEISNSKLTSPKRQWRKRYSSIVSDIYFEHFFFKSMVEASIPCIRRSDKELLSNLAKEYLQEIKGKNKDFEEISSKLTYQYGLKGEANNNSFMSNESVSFLEMTEDTFKNIIKRFGKRNQRSWMSKPYAIYEYIFHSDNFLAIYWENKEDKAFYEEIREFEETTNLEIEGHDISKPYRLSLSPGETHLVICKLLPDANEYIYRYNSRFKIFGFTNF